VHTSNDIKPFGQTLIEQGLTLERGQTDTLQINVGLLCNQQCKHCHLDAGPDRIENMHSGTVSEVISYARRSEFTVADITGGAPELNPNLPALIQGLSPIIPRIIVRSNLTSLYEADNSPLLDLFSKNNLVVVASFPSFNESQTDSQRGNGIFQASITALKKLNELGYGKESSGLELNLISNPAGAFLPPSQAISEERFRQVLLKKWGIQFNRLFNFANVPAGRFLTWLEMSGNLQPYMKRLVSAFNPCSVDSVMCRTLVSVSWDGFLYDCDFNLATRIPLGGSKIHISEMAGRPATGSHIALADHCYTCTAGAGFT